jgi:hypothetical protein
MSNEIVETHLQKFQTSQSIFDFLRKAFPASVVIKSKGPFRRAVFVILKTNQKSRGNCRWARFIFAC